MIYVYAPVLQQGTRELIEALGAKRLLKFDGMNFIHRGSVVAFDEKEDAIVCWGACVPPIGNLRIVNSNVSPLRPVDLIYATQRLRHGQPIRVADTYRVAVTSTFEKPFSENPIYGTLVRFKDAPTHSQYFYRMSYEYKFHVVNDTVIQVLLKTPTLSIATSSTRWVPRKNAHPYFKTEEHGWTWKTVKTAEIPPKLGVIAIKLVKALQLDFAVLTFGGLTPDYDDYEFHIWRKTSIGPSLNEDGVKLYKDAIYELIKRK